MKPVVWSYSLLNNYLTCPKQTHARYITKELKYEESPEAAYGNRVHSAAETALKLKQFPPVPYDNMERFFHDIYAIPHIELEPEQKVGVDRDWKYTAFFADNVWGRGKLDAPIIVNYETAILFDWKSGNVREDPFELEVQAVLLKAKYPTLTNIKGCYIWLKEDKYGPVYDLAAKIPETKRAIQDIMRKVEQGLFYANKTPLCGWCPIKHCKHWRDRNVAK